MTSLMLDGLKMQKKDLSFLPQLGSYRKINKKNETINTGRSSIGYENDEYENDKRHRTIEFANNMRTSLKKKGK